MTQPVAATMPQQVISTKVSPTVEEIEALRKTVPPGPVVMINLLRFRPKGGREAYARYLQVASSVAPPEVSLRYVGNAGADVAAGEEWDFVILGEYPSFDVFADFMVHPVYQNEAVPLRTLALERALFMISQPVDLMKAFHKP